MTLIVYFHRDFCAVNISAPYFICMKEEQQAVICFLMKEDLAGAEICGKMLVQYGKVLCCNGMSASGLRGSKMVTQALSWRKELDQQLHAWLVCQSKIF